MELPRIVCKIWRLTGLKSRNFHTPPVFSDHAGGDPVAGPILRIFLIIHTPMASSGARAYNGGLGAEPPVGDQGGFAP